MIIRNDLRTSSTTIPKKLREVILRIGGTNVYDEPMFRLILAEDRIVQAAGAWSIWSKETSLEDRGGLGIKAIFKMIKEGRTTQEINEYVNGRGSITPIRVDRGMVDLPLYNFKGFILEKWKPAASFGPPDEWTAIRFEGAPAAGPYPEHGGYELCAGPTPYMLTVTQVEDAIRETFHIIDNRPSTPMARMSQIMAQIETAQEADAKNTMNVIEAKRKEDKMLYKNSSLVAGRARNLLAEQAGIKEHYGN